MGGLGHIGTDDGRRKAMRGRRLAVIAGLLATAATAATAATVALATPAQSGPITIGWAYDPTGTMAPFDTSAVAARNCT